jgi:enoyl-CoA hydratase/carnithine racemase
MLLIGINRPAKRNGWTPAMFQQLAEAYTRLDDEPELRVGLLHAFGEHFTAGLDLPVIAEFMKSGQKAIPAGLVEPHDYGLPATAAAPSPWWPPSRASALPSA